MIPASIDFMAQESNRDTADPVFFFTFLPHYFATGMAPGAGTFVNMTFVAPGRLQVNEDAALASWTSPVLTARVGNLPTAVTPSWNLNFPGFDCAVEYRTAATEEDLAATSWTVWVSGWEVSLNRFYQWRISFVAFRSWAYDTIEEAEASGSSAWALDSPDPEDPYESFAVDSAFGSVAFIENARFLGIFEIDQADIKDPGTCTDECPSSFGDLVAGDHTLILGNRDHKYSSTHPNFIFGGEANWRKKHLLIQMAYRLSSGALTEKITLYRGIVQSWGPGQDLVDEAGKLQEHTVQVYTRDLMADIIDRKIGVPADDGTPQPLVMGEIFRQMDQMADETLGDPDAVAEFEHGNTEELTGVDSDAGGVVSVDNADPINGTYYLHTEVAAANAYAKGRSNLAIAGNEVLFTAALRFTAVPALPADKNMYFMGLFDNGGNEILQLFVGSDFKVYAYAAGQWKETQWYITQTLGMIKTVSIGVSGATAGTLKIWVGGNEVLTWDADWSALSINGGFIGPHNGAVAEAWSLDSDSWKIFPNWWPQLFRVRGGPFESIGTVYIDGAIKVGADPLYTNMNRRGLRYGPTGVSVALMGGVTQVAGMEQYPEYGAIAFTDYTNKISGTVTAYFRKNDLFHWVDIVRAILAVNGLDIYLDESAAAAAKAVSPSDSVGCFFENLTMGDAIKTLAATCLFSFYRSQDRLVLQASTGEAPVTYELALTEKNLRGGAPVDDQEGLMNQVFVKYGLYDRNSRLSHMAKDDESISYIGVFDTEIDLTWGSIAGSDNGPMAVRNAERLLRHLVGGRRVMDESPGRLDLVRLEVWDAAQVDLPAIGAPLILRINKKSINLNTPRGVKFLLIEFPGEGAFF